MKKLRKIALIIIMTIATFMVSSAFTIKTYAATGSRYLTIKELRASGYGYKALEKNIWKITESNSSGTIVNYDHTIYCLKGGPGFGSTTFGSGTPTVREYTRYFNMKDVESITGNYANALPSPSSNTYKSLLWLLENLYVAPKQNATTEEMNTAEEYRELLLERAGIVDGYITDDDIDAVQQLAVWHFTNNDGYKVENNSSGTFEFWINAVSGSNGNYNPLSDEIGEGAIYGGERAEECQELYDYLVETAETVANDYEITTATQPYELANLQPQQSIGNNKYIIGPFRINKISNTPGTLTGVFKNGNTVITPQIQNGSGTVFNTLEDTIGQNFYIALPFGTSIQQIELTISGSYFDTTLNYWSVEGALAEDQPVVEVERTKEPYEDKVTFTPLPPYIPPVQKFDLALRKFITQINGNAPTVSREPQISTQALNDLAAGGGITTAVKTHPKNALVVETGDIVTYTIRVYNEGQVAGYVKQITDHLPIGLKLAENSTINQNNGWTNPSGDGRTIVTDKLAGTILEAFNGSNLRYLDVQIECEVIATVQSTDTILKNIAEITVHSNNVGDVTVTDIDSTPNNVNKNNYGTTSQQDDDDFEQLIILGKYLDLSLRKFITAVGDNELVDENQNYIRAPQVDVTPLLGGETTAIYNHNKKPVNVDVGDIVTYTIRVYNEGQIDGYVHEITDYLPEYLEFVNNEFNASYGWRISADGRVVTTDITSTGTEYSASRDTIFANRTSGNNKVLLNAFDREARILDYIDVKIQCRVKDTGIAEKITNIAEITSQADITGTIVTDKDSTPDNKTLPSDETLPNYKDNEINRGDEYIPGQEDDDDFEKVIVQKFDLALRKFITGVNDKEVAGRVPSFSIDTEGKMIYTHPKTPVEVANGDIVIYTLRVYNEGNQSGYANEVKDDIPEGLIYLPDNELNTTYRWKMYKEDGTETSDVAEAKTIKTDYLSKEQELETQRENLINAFDKTTMTQPNHKEVKIAFKVTEPNTSDRILINTAEITEDKDENGNTIEDIDSTPDNNEDGEDDIDIEKVKVKYFDLALEKIISEYSINVNGKTTVTKTKHKFGVQPEPVVKVETLQKTRKNAIIKFKYQIKITNEGEIAGYATEIKDYIPNGLKFEQKDNPKWKLSEDGKTITTDQLKDKLLQPGESAVIEVTFQWINGENNLGLKQNWAEISEDKNDSDSPDIDSTPDNFKKGEDDIDDASVILSIVTGIGENYIILASGILAILAGGLVLIKKFVV